VNVSDDGVCQSVRLFSSDPDRHNNTQEKAGQPETLPQPRIEHPKLPVGALRSPQDANRTKKVLKKTSVVDRPEVPRGLEYKPDVEFCDTGCVSGGDRARHSKNQ
jgi:hypothetical protein